jgi:hypothetical protein
MPRCPIIKMVEKPDLTDECDNRGASEEQLCGFACEAFCIKWGFLEFSEA